MLQVQLSNLEIVARKIYVLLQGIVLPVLYLWYALYTGGSALYFGNLESILREAVGVYTDTYSQVNTSSR